MTLRSVLLKGEHSMTTLLALFEESQNEETGQGLVEYLSMANSHSSGGWCLISSATMSLPAIRSESAHDRLSCRFRSACIHPTRRARETRCNSTGNFAASAPGQSPSRMVFDPNIRVGWLRSAALLTDAIRAGMAQF